MKLLKQKGPRCLVWSAAMLFDVEPETIMQYLGHDCLTGVHMQEIQSFAMSIGKALVPYEPRPQLGEESVQPPSWSKEPWLKHQGIMLGETSKGNLHAVAWDGHDIFDPAINPTFVGYHQFWMMLHHNDSRIS